MSADSSVEGLIGKGVAILNGPGIMGQTHALYGIAYALMAIAKAISENKANSAATTE